MKPVGSFYFTCHNAGSKTHQSFQCIPPSLDHCYFNNHLGFKNNLCYNDVS